MTCFCLFNLIAYPFFTTSIQFKADMGTGPTRATKSIQECFSKITARPQKEIYKGMLTSVTYPTLISNHINLFEESKWANFAQDLKMYVSVNIVYVNIVLIACTSNLFFHPMDTIIFRLMMQSGSPHPLYKGPLDCLVKTVTQDGIFSLYKGISMGSLRIAISAILINKRLFSVGFD